MSLLTIALIASSGFIHALWNLWAKRSESPLAFLWSLQWIAVAIYGPLALWSIGTRPVPLAGIFWLGVSVALHGVYVLLLAKSYALADFSQAYPVMRGTAPLLVPLLGALVLRERLAAAGWAGVFLIVCGVLAVGGGYKLWRASRPAVRIGLAVGLAITCYTLADKVALNYLPAVALNAASNAGNLAVLTIPALRTGRALTPWKASPGLVVATGVLSPLSYLLFLTALAHAPAVAIAPMRELGIVFGTALGVFVLREAHGAQRIVGATLIAAGAALLGVFG